MQNITRTAKSILHRHVTQEPHGANRGNPVPQLLPARSATNAMQCETQSPSPCAAQSPSPHARRPAYAHNPPTN